MGDAIYEMYVRQSLIGRHPGRTTHDLHIMATRLVRAGAQAFTAAALMDRLTEEERGGIPPRPQHAQRHRTKARGCGGLPRVHRL